MSYLIVSATLKEIAPLARMLTLQVPTDIKSGSLFGNEKLSFLITGVGQMQTAFWLARVFAEKSFDAVFNLGIAGSFSADIPVSSVVRITEEILADLGAENGNEHLDLFDLRLAARDSLPFKDGILKNQDESLISGAIRGLRACRSVTVNRALSREESIQEIKNKYAPQVVNMEGAAVFYACLNNEVPFQQIRAISDMVGPRDKNLWNIEGAIAALTETASAYINQLILA